VSSDADDLLTADEVVSYLAERPWLRKTALSCVLPAQRAEERWLYRRADLDAWVKSQQDLAGPSGAEE
jgi:hypothetical protein